ncbi:MAG: membrane integrity-associated transporter subunit PqiC [Proteobacteria bacterium]|nr:membrane integrity-associated transporter subunit PqiC [Pseudomonadota bacterium]
MKATPTAAALACLLLAGCTGLFTSHAQPEQTYYLRAPAIPAGGGPVAAPAAPSVRIARPSPDPGLDSSHLMLLQTDHRMSFYTGARWPAPMPEMVSALAVQTLRAGGQWGSVADSASPFPSDYLLQITVRRFDADYTTGGAAPAVQVVFDCVIGRRDGREVVGTFVVTGSAAASANRLGEVVAAFEQATDQALTALSTQTFAVVSADRASLAQKGASPPPSSSRHNQ